MFKFKITQSYDEANTHAMIMAYWHHMAYGIFNWGTSNHFMVAPINTPNCRFETLIRVVH